MKKPVVIVGIGEIGSVFARGFLRLGHPVYPVTSTMDMAEVSSQLPQPELVMIAVGEASLHEVLPKVPEVWKEKVALIQNELLPKDWEQHGFSQPSVISVWFEKKKGQDVKVVVASPAFGPSAQLLVDALAQLDIPGYTVASEQAMLQELVRKNYYILTSNIAGLKTGGSVGELWSRHRDFAESVALDVYKLQLFLTGKELDHQALVDVMVEAFEGDPDHQCMGRSAPARLQRALQMADKAGLDVPVLQAIQESL